MPGRRVDDRPTRGRHAPKRRRGESRAEDERPRGYEPTRMRKVWADIDQARDKLGLGQRVAGAEPSWSVEGLLGWAAGMVEEASARLGSAPDWVRAALADGHAQPASMCATVARGCVGLMRRVPLVGQLVSLLPLDPDPDGQS
jgi:hypothetical protein